MRLVNKTIYLGDFKIHIYIYDNYIYIWYLYIYISYVYIIYIINIYIIYIYDIYIYEHLIPSTKWTLITTLATRFPATFDSCWLQSSSRWLVVKLPSSKLTSMEYAPFIDDLPTKMVIVHSYVSLPEGIHDIPHYITVLPYFTHENPMQNPMEKIPHEITIWSTPKRHWTRRNLSAHLARLKPPMERTWKTPQKKLIKTY